MVMGIGSRTIDIIIRARDQFSSTLNKANMSLQQLSVAAGVAGAAITAFGVAGVLVMANIVTAAGNAQEVVSRFGQVFSDVGTEAEKVAKDLRDNFGLATSSAKNLLASTGDLLIGFGFTGQEALNMSETISKLGVDLASFQDLQGGAAQAVHILNKAILGERESLTTLGVKLLDTDVLLRVAENGMADLTGTALLQAKAMATLELIMEQTAKAQGDFSRTSGEFNNQVRIMKERTKELREEFGKHLLPMATKLIGIITGFVDWFNNLSEEQKKFIVIIGAIAVGLALIIGPLLLFLAILPMLTACMLALSTASLPISLTVIAIALAIILLIAGIVALIVWWDKLGTKTKIILGIMFPFVVLPIAIMKNWDKLKIGMAEVWNFIAATSVKGVNFIIWLINKWIDAYNKLPAFFRGGGKDIGNIAEVSIGPLFDIESMKKAVKVQEEMATATEKTATAQAKISTTSFSSEQFASTADYENFKRATDITRKFGPESQQLQFIPEIRDKSGNIVTVNIENVNGVDPENISMALNDELKNRILI